ncbi:MAG: calcium sensor EFh [Rhodocyclales bacterium]|nr:calcium sensor EFh [Rhodocyclales bacterium]
MKTPNTLLLILAVSASGIALAQQPPAAGPMHHDMMERLKSADTDKDGLISRAEAEKGLPRLAEHFDRLDTNKDGKISPDELKAMAEKMRHHRGHHAHGPFVGADANHDHVITRDEILQRNEKTLQDFNAADTNKDGKLSNEEMKAWHDKMRGQHAPRGDAPPPAK